MMVFWNIIFTVLLSCFSFWAGIRVEKFYGKSVINRRKKEIMKQSYSSEEGFIPACVDKKLIYDGLVHYFNTEKPYLDPELTISEVASHLLTNRSYLSKSISLYEGDNFCTFVNRYRVRYALELYHRNNKLRVSELATLSGFNSPTAFNIAFKAEMNITPGEWCRRYKVNHLDRRIGVQKKPPNKET